MLWIDRIHRWTGGFVGLLLAMLGLTGTLLVYKDAWLRATVPQASQPLIQDSAALDAAVERMLSDASTRPTNIIFPSESLGVFRLSYGEEGGGAYADQSGTIVARWSSKWERTEIWLFDFHHHLFMGDVGTRVAGVLALTGFAFVVTGLILWWRSRKAFSFRVLPTRFTRLQIVRHHRDLGAVAAPLLLISLVTASMLAFRPVSEFLLAPLSANTTITSSLAAPKVKGGALAADFDWRAALRMVHERFPDAQLRTIGIPESEGSLIRVRARQPAEWLPNGRTIFWFDPADGRLVDVRDALALPRSARAYNAVYPIHAAKVGGVAYKIVMTASGLALTLLGSLAVYGFWSFRLRASAFSPNTPTSAQPRHRTEQQIRSSAPACSKPSQATDTAASATRAEQAQAIR
jgi:uncharacterized iron-regulated membrane protein